MFLPLPKGSGRRQSLLKQLFGYHQLFGRLHSWTKFEDRHQRISIVVIFKVVLQSAELQSETGLKSANRQVWRHKSLDIRLIHTSDISIHTVRKPSSSYRIAVIRGSGPAMNEVHCCRYVKGWDVLHRGITVSELNDELDPLVDQIEV